MKMGIQSDQNPAGKDHVTWRYVSPDVFVSWIWDEVGCHNIGITYAIDPMTAKNASFFSEILGQDGHAKTFVVDVTYTVTPD